MDEPSDSRGTLSFTLGLLAGTAVGAGLTLWLAPRIRGEIRQRLATSAGTLDEQVSDRYRTATGYVAETLDDLAARGEQARDDLADAVVHGARDVERLAKRAKAVRFTGTS